MIESEDEEEEVQESVKVTEEIQGHSSSTQEHREDDLTTTTKKLKLDPVSPKKPGAKKVVEKAVEKLEKTPVIAEDPTEAADDEDAEVKAAQADDIEQAKEAVEIKQAAAKW